MPTQEPLEFPSLSALGEYLDHLTMPGSPARRALGHDLRKKEKTFTAGQIALLQEQISANLTPVDKTIAVASHRAAFLIKKSLLDGPSNLALALRYSPPKAPVSEILRSSLLEHIALTEITISNTALILDLHIREESGETLKKIFDIHSSADVAGLDVLCHLNNEYLPALKRLTAELCDLTAEQLGHQVHSIQQNLAQAPVRGVVYLQPIDAQRWKEAASPSGPQWDDYS